MGVGLEFAAWFFKTGHAADVILVVLLVEAFWLRTRSWLWIEIFGMLGAAVLIVIGLRAALMGMPWYWVAIPLTLSLPVHLLDLSTRFSERAD